MVPGWFQECFRSVSGLSLDGFRMVSGWFQDAKRVKAGRKVGGFCTELGRKTVHKGPSRHVVKVSRARRTREMKFFPKRSLTAQFSLIGSEILAAMVETKLGQLPSPLVVLDDETCPHQERLGDLAHRAARQAQHAGQDIEPSCPTRQDFEVLRLGWPEAQIVDSLQATSPMKMIQRDGSFAFGPGTTTSRLEEPKSQAGSSLRPFWDFDEDQFVHGPSQRLAAVP